MMVKCIDNIDYADELMPLTIGKVYKVEREDHYDYWVTDDEGLIEHYDKEFFEIL